MGRISSGKTIEDLEKHLKNKGFEHHPLAWVDDGEVLGMRYPENFHQQYHIRVFEDGSVHGHYETTVESHPIAHIQEWGMEPRQEEFLRFLEDCVQVLDTIEEPGNTSSQSAPATSIGSPKSG